MQTWLKDDGLLFVNDYVGPERFQWEPRQHDVANAMLSALPERLRQQWDGGTKRRTHAPSRLRMRFVDPSEAAESRRIMPALRERFEILEERDLGGSIVNLVLDQIAHHFPDADEEAMSALAALFAVEDGLLVEGEVTSDYKLVVATPRVPVSASDPTAARRV